jgi:CRISPR/Cas system-associated exonuclease Cas4 (RecB family)
MPLTTLSQASLQDYADCNRRFQLRYLDRLVYPAVETEPALENEKHQQEGETFHRLVQQHLLGIPAEKVGQLANTPNLQRWWNNYLNDKDLGGLKDLRGLYPELTLSAPLPPFRLLAKFDLVALLPDGKAIIYDWKTYRKRPKNEFLAIRWQTRVYRALLAKAGNQLNGGQPIAPENIEMVYWFSDFPTEPARFPYNAAQYKRDWDALEKLAAEITTAVDGSTRLPTSFPLTEDEQKCAWCSYRSYCNRGVRAGEGEDAEVETSLEINLEQIGEIEL